MHKIIYLILLFVFSDFIEQAAFDRLFQYKLKCIEKYRPEIAWKYMKVDHSFQFHLEKISTSRIIGVAIEKIDDELYIVNNLQHQIVVFRMSGELKTKLGQEGVEPGEFLFPRSLAFYHNKFYFVSNIGIDIYHKDLTFAKRIRPFLNITKISVFEDSIYCNTLESFRNHYPLVFKLDLNGKIEKYYHDERIDKSMLKEDKYGNVCIIENMIVFIPNNWNMIYFLDNRLNLVNKTKLEYGLLDDLEDWNNLENSFSTPNKVSFCNMIASAKTIENRIFVLLDIPRLEILEISQDGKICCHYYNDQEVRLMKWLDIAIEKENNRVGFYVLGLSMDKKNKLADYKLYRLTN